MSAVICIPAYNEEDRIGFILDNVKSYNIPVVVINDGSTDKTSEIVLNSGVRLVSNHVNLGYGGAINRAFEVTDQDIIIVCDADSLPYSHSLDMVLEAFDDPRVGAATGRHQLVNPRTGIANWLNYIIYESKANLDSYLAERDENWHLNGLLMAFRRDALPEAINKETNQDAYLGHEVRKKGYSVRFLPEAISMFKAPATVKDIIRSRKRVCRGHVVLAYKYGITEHAFTEVPFPLYASFVLRAVPRGFRGLLAFLFGTLVDCYYRLYWMLMWRCNRVDFAEYKWKQIESTKSW